MKSLFPLWHYTTYPDLNEEGLIALVQAVVAQAPADPAPAVKPRLQRLQGEATEFASGSAERRAAETRGRLQEVRKVDQRLDAAWGANFRRVEAWSMMPEGSHPQVAKAQEVMKKVFGNGLGFVTAKYSEEWAKSQALLDLIKAEKLEPTLIELVGAEFVKELKDAHQAYRELVDVKAPEPKPMVRDGIRRLADDLAQYALQIIAAVDPEKPETAEMARRALKPIDDYREQVKARRAKPPKPTA
jgi:hypothetical protein